MVVRHQKGPLAEERLRYLAFHAEQQMSPLTLQGIARYTLVVAKALCLADRPGELITQHEIGVEAARWAIISPQHPPGRLQTELGPITRITHF